eukprot:6441610-Amphidinium_carterae.1
MKAPTTAANPAPIMKPPPVRREGPMEVATVQPVKKPGFKGPPEGITIPPWKPAANPVPSASPAAVKTPFKGPPKGHPDYREE